jgi:7,8-dihydroneopterin aldolase/epimerase/oxygenase
LDTIFINDLRVETVIGIYDWERRIRQTVSINLEIAADIRRAAASDSIDDTLNYKAVAKRLIEFIEASSFQLVETLAERIAAIVLTEFDVSRVTLTLNKPGAIRGARDVGVRIERTSADFHA